MTAPQHRFLLVRETDLVTDEGMYLLARALEAYAQEVAAAWGKPSPTVDVVDKMQRVSDLYHPIRFVSGSHEDPGALGYHYYDPIRRGPAAVVHVDRCSGFNFGSFSVVECASHEVAEAMGNPDLTQWRPHPDPARFGVQVAFEFGDPTQGTFLLESGGARWQMCSFVTPAWFDPAANEEAARQRVLNSTGFDRGRLLTRPGEVGVEGYVILRELRDGRWHVWFEDYAGVRFGAVPTKKAAERFHKKLASARGRLLLDRAMAEPVPAAP